MIADLRFRISDLMHSQKVVTPVKTGVQALCNYLNKLDSGLRRNDNKQLFSAFYETIRFRDENIWDNLAH
ncbi:MAG: hypothetical protein V1736_12790 [Pseudomonadota bacterium]